MAYTLADAAAAARRRRELREWKPGDPILPEHTGLIAPRVPAPPPPPMTSTYRAGVTERAPGPQEYAGLGLPTPTPKPTPAGEQEPARRKFFTRERLLSALQGAAAGIQADVGPASAGHGFEQGLMKGIVGASALASARAKEEAAGRAAELSQAGKLALAEARRETPAQIEEAAAAGARGRLPYRLQELKASSEAQVERVKKIAALEKGKSSAELTRLKAQARAQAAREIDMAGYNLRRPENVNLLEDVTEEIYAGYLTTTPRDFSKIKREE